MTTMTMMILMMIMKNIQTSMLTLAYAVGRERIAASSQSPFVTFFACGISE